MFKKFFYSLIFLALQFFYSTVASGQISIVSPAVFAGPSIPDNNDVDSPYVLCTDTVLLQSQSLAQNWVNLSPNSADYEILAGGGVNTFLRVRLKTSSVVSFTWKKSGQVSYSIYIRKQKPTLPLAGQDTTICQNSLKLYANKPVIGSGKWFSLRGAVFQNDTQHDTRALQLPTEKDTLVWQISTPVCGALSDTLVLDNQSPSSPNAGIDQFVCVDTVMLQASALLPKEKGKWTVIGGANVQIATPDSVQTFAYGLSGLSKFVWQVTKSETCTLRDTVQIQYTKVDTANILTQDKSLCTNKLDIEANNLAGQWNILKGGGTVLLPNVRKTVVEGLSADTNLLVWEVKNGYCPTTYDTLLLLNKTVAKPIISDSCFLSPFSSTLSLNLRSSLKSNETGIWTSQSAPVAVSEIDLQNNLLNQSATFSPKETGEYNFMYKASNGLCSDSAFNLYYLITKAELQSDTCIYTEQLTANFSLRPKILPNANELPRWILPNNQVADSLTIHQNLPVGYYRFVYGIRNALCNSCEKCHLANYDTMYVRIVNKAKIVPNASVCTTDSVLALLGNVLQTGDLGTWSSPQALTFSSAASNSTNVGSMSFGSNKVFWTVSNGNCASSDSLFVYRLSKPMAGSDKCYKAGIAQSDTLLATSPKANEIGEWFYSSVGNDIVFVPLSNTNGLVANTQNARKGSFSVQWRISSVQCPAGFSDELKLNVISNPEVPNDTFFVLPAQPRSIKALSLIDPIMENQRWLIAPSNVVSNSATLQLSDTLKSGVYPFVYQISDKQNICSFSANFNVTFLSKPTILATTCLKSASDVLLRAKSPALGEIGTWKVDTLGLPQYADNSLNADSLLLFGLKPQKYKVFWIISLGKYSVKDSLLFTNLSKFTLSFQSLCVQEKQVELKPDALFPALRPYETAYWVKKNANAVGVLSKGNALFDTLTQLQPSQQMLGLVVKDMNESCADTAFVKLTVVSKAKAFAESPICSNSSFALVNATNTPNASETGKWSYLRSFANIKPLIQDSVSYTNVSISNLGNRFTKLKWEIRSKFDSTCFSFDTLQTLLVVGTKPTVFYHDTCLVGANSFVLKGSQPASYEVSKWLKLPSSELIAKDSPSFLYPSLVPGVNRFSYVIFDSTSEYKCASSELINVNVVNKAKIVSSDTCLILPTQSIATLKAKLYADRGNAIYTFIQNADNVISTSKLGQDSLFNLQFSQTGRLKIYWQVQLSPQCVSRDSITVTVIPKANAGNDLCLVAPTDSVLLNANAPALAKQETGFWTKIPFANREASTVLSDNTLQNARLKFLSKGRAMWVWEISNGTCGQNKDTLQVMYHTKANVGFDTCLVGQDSVLLKAIPISSEKEIGCWESVVAKGVLSSENRFWQKNISSGFSQFTWTISDSLANFSCKNSDTVKIGRVVKAQIFQNDTCLVLPRNGVSLSNIQTNRDLPNISHYWFSADSLIPQPTNASVFNLTFNKPKTSYKYIWKIKLSEACQSQDSVKVTVVSKAYAGRDTCLVIDKLAMKADSFSVQAGEIGQWTSLNGNAQISMLGQPFSEISQLQKGVNEFLWVVKSQEKSCQNQDTIKLNYITKANAGGYRCFYFDDKLKVDLPNISLQNTENGTWTLGTIGPRLISSPNGFALEALVKGLNKLTWTVRSNEDPTCQSESEAVYYVYTPSGFGTLGNMYLCRRDTTLSSPLLGENEIVTWQTKPANKIDFTQTNNQKVKLKGLSNDTTYSIFRNITLPSASCFLKDSIKVLNRQVDTLFITTKQAQVGAKDTLFTCLTVASLELPDPAKDIPTATFQWSNITSPGTSNVNMLKINSPGNNLIYNTQYLLQSGNYFFTGTVKNFGCSTSKTIIIQKRQDIAGVDNSVETQICDRQEYPLKELGLRYNFVPDSAKWTVPDNAPFPTILTPNAINPDSVVLYGLSPKSNFVDYQIYSQGCKAIVRIKVINNRTPPDAQIITPDALLCQTANITLKAKKPLFDAPDPVLFKYFWSKSTSEKDLIGNVSDTAVNVNLNVFGAKYSYYFIIQNGICPLKIDTVSLTNYQKIDTCRAGSDDTLCVKRVELSGLKNSYAKGQWLVLGNNKVDTINTNPVAVVGVPNNVNRYVWRVYNGACEKKDTLLLTLGDSISKAQVLNKNRVVCNEPSVLLQAVTPLLGTGAWYLARTPIDSNPTFRFNFQNPQPKDTIPLVWTISNQYCSSSDTSKVYYYAAPTTALAGEDRVVQNKEVEMKANKPSIGKGMWTLVSGMGNISNPADPNALLTGLGFGDNEFKWTISNGLCPISTDNVVITLKDFYVPEAFSPNGDNKNDKFEIQGLENYQGVVLVVYNRWGREVFSSSNYKNDWEGTGLDDDTYFYVIEVPTAGVKNGFVVLKRK